MNRSVRIFLLRLGITCCLVVALAEVASAQQTPALRSITYRLSMSRTSASRLLPSFPKE